VFTSDSFYDEPSLPYDRYLIRAGLSKKASHPDVRRLIGCLKKFRSVP
jgi:hypothetical protein